MFGFFGWLVSWLFCFFSLPPWLDSTMEMWILIPQLQKCLTEALCPLGIFCHSFVTAVFLVWCFIFTMTFCCACQHALIWSFSSASVAQKTFSDVWKIHSTSFKHMPVVSICLCFYNNQTSKVTFTRLNCLAFSKVSHSIKKTPDFTKFCLVCWAKVNLLSPCFWEW